jgi:hypothetical protein
LIGKVEGVHAADTELDILDVVLGSGTPWVCELLVARINTDDVTDHFRQTERDGSCSATDPSVDGAHQRVSAAAIRLKEPKNQTPGPSTGSSTSDRCIGGFKRRG